MKGLQLMDQEFEILNEKAMKSIYGGNKDLACGCACAYENHGGSSTHDNAYANSADGKSSKENFKVVVRKTGSYVDMV